MCEVNDAYLGIFAQLQKRNKLHTVVDSWLISIQVFVFVCLLIPRRSFSLDSSNLNWVLVFCRTRYLFKLGFASGGQSISDALNYLHTIVGVLCITSDRKGFR